MTTAPDLGGDYRRCRQRLSALLLAAPATVWDQPVPACPGWDVKAAVAHMVGNIEDGMAGRLTGRPPNEEQTAEQVARHAADQPETLVATWAELAVVFERVVTAHQIVPVVMDVLAHEHDIRGAIGVIGDRGEELLDWAAQRLIAGIAVPANLEFHLGDDVVSTAPVDGPTHRVTTTPFEVFRLRLGRRSVEQVAALAWDVVPEAYVDDLFVFGPRSTPLIE